MTASPGPHESIGNASQPLRGRGWGWLLIGGAVLAAAGIAYVNGSRTPPPRRLTLAAGWPGTTRAILAQALVVAAAGQGLDMNVIEPDGARAVITAVDTGAADFGMVPGGFGLGSCEHVRIVSPLQVEALHLLVRGDLGRTVGGSLSRLSGRTVDIGPRGTATESLVLAVLAFAGLTPGDGRTAGTFVASNLEYRDIEAALATAPQALPDVIFHLAAIPSKLALALVRGAGYRLVALPFAEAFRIDATIDPTYVPDAPSIVDRQHVYEPVIPAFTYQTDPAVPAEPLKTIGMRLLLVANERVPPAIVEAVLDAALSSRFARLTHPQLDASVLDLPVPIPRHEGSVRYASRGTPVISDATVETMSNTLSVLGAAVGGALFLWQGWRRRRETRREEILANYFLRVTGIERQALRLELAATLVLEPLVDLQRELLELQREVLDRYAAGDLGDYASLGSLLGPLNAARAHVRDLILHLRDNIEEQAEAEGRSAQALWTEALTEPGTDVPVP